VKEEKYYDPVLLRKNAENSKVSTQKFFKSIKKRCDFDLDEKVHGLHETVFSQVDCLLCANCCRILGPRITDRDIEKLSKFIKIKPSIFIEKYLKTDEEGDYIFKSMPCPFLGYDNYCQVYRERPRACREYPHTNRRRFHQLLDITLKNTYICPAVFEIVSELKNSFARNY
jgi:uncharacterized protein